MSSLTPFLDPRLLTLLLLGAMMLGFHDRQRLGRSSVAFWLAPALLLLALFGARSVQIVLASVAKPPEWDFQLFWIYGRTVVEGLNPYVAENLHKITGPLNLSEGPLAELFCFYPPPTLFLFAPLGWFGPRTACALWYVLHGALLVLDVYLLWSLFLKREGGSGLVWLAALVVAFEATRTTLYFAQINFLLLAMLLLFIRDRERMRSGAWLALGILVKPVLVFLSLYLLLRQRWSALACMLATFAVASVLSIVTFGPQTFVTYLTDNPIANNMPATLYAEPINQSLLATVLRLAQYDLTAHSPYASPHFLLLGGLVTLITTGVILKLQAKDDDLALALLVAFALLIFPKTLAHYSLLLLVPLAVLWKMRREVPGGIWSVTALSVGTFAAVSAECAFLAIAGHWMAMVAVAVSQQWVPARAAMIEGTTLSPKPTALRSIPTAEPAA